MRTGRTSTISRISRRGTAREEVVAMIAESKTETGTNGLRIRGGANQKGQEDAAVIGGGQLELEEA